MLKRLFLDKFISLAKILDYDLKILFVRLTIDGSKGCIYDHFKRIAKI